MKVGDMLCLAGLTEKGSSIITGLRPAEACHPVPGRAVDRCVSAVGKMQWIYCALCMSSPVTPTSEALSYAEAEQVEKANLPPL